MAIVIILRREWRGPIKLRLSIVTMVIVRMLMMRVVILTNGLNRTGTVMCHVVGIMRIKQMSGMHMIMTDQAHTQGKRNQRSQQAPRLSVPRENSASYRHSPIIYHGSWACGEFYCGSTMKRSQQGLT
ncbi:MAG: hypothetical protein AAFV45_05190 [Pseudomonadota bacterium]